ncbi:MAG: TadE family protein [Rhizomicrobium sp.]
MRAKADITQGRGARRTISGAVAIEFAFIVPIFLVLLLAIFEVGIMFFAQFVLKNATVATARVIRTGNSTSYSANPKLVDYICSKTDSSLGKLAGSLVLPSCSSKLQVYEVDSTAATSTAFTLFPKIKSSDLANNGVTGSSLTMAALDSTAKPCAVIVLRVTYAWDVATPGLSWFLVNSGTSQHLLTATEVFQNEPKSGASSQCS